MKHRNCEKLSKSATKKIKQCPSTEYTIEVPLLLNLDKNFFAECISFYGKLCLELFKFLKIIWLKFTYTTIINWYRTVHNYCTDIYLNKLKKLNWFWPHSCIHLTLYSFSLKSFMIPMKTKLFMTIILYFIINRYCFAGWWC